MIRNRLWEPSHVLFNTRRHTYPKTYIKHIATHLNEIDRRERDVKKNIILQIFQTSNNSQLISTFIYRQEHKSNICSFTVRIFLFDVNIWLGVKYLRGKSDFEISKMFAFVRTVGIRGIRASFNCIQTHYFEYETNKLHWLTTIFCETFKNLEILCRNF